MAFSGEVNVGYGLHSVCIMELDKGDDLILTWAYPSVEPDMQEVLLSRTHLRDDPDSADAANRVQYFSKFRDLWHYNFITHVAPVEEEEEEQSQLLAFEIVVLSKQFDPERFFSICRGLSTVYPPFFDARRVLEAFLAIFVSGKLNIGSFTFRESEWDSRQALLVSTLKDLIDTYQYKAILLWSAMVIKRRIFVYSSRLPALLHFVRGLPLLVWHRQKWDSLRPVVSYPIGPRELHDLMHSHVQVAGFTDPAIRSREELYDVFVDLDAEEISVSEHAKEDFVMGPVHKEVASFLVSSYSTGTANDAEVVKLLAEKTLKLVSNIQKICQKDDQTGAFLISFDMLRKAGLPPGVDRFLFNLGVAENFRVC